MVGRNIKLTKHASCRWKFKWDIKKSLPQIRLSVALLTARSNDRCCQRCELFFQFTERLRIYNYSYRY